MAERLTQPNTRNPAGRIIEIDGVGQVEVGPEFFALPPDQQQQVVAEIVADYGGQRDTPAQAQQQPAPEQPELPPQRVPDFLYQYAPTTALGLDAMADHAVGAIQGIGEGWDRAADLLEGGYNHTIGALLGHESHSADPTRTTADLIANRGPMGAAERLAGQLGHGSEGGHLVGEIVADALLTRGIGGPIRQGMAVGALHSEAENPAEFALDIAEGGAGGYLGDRVVRTATGILAPMVDPAARLLRQAGVRLTPGQAVPETRLPLAGTLREFEDKSMSLPFAGPQLTAARRQGFEDFAVSIPRQSLETVQTRLPHRAIPDIPAGANGQQAIRHTGDQLSAIYEDIVPQLRLQADPQLVTDLQSVATRLQTEAISDAGQRTFERLIRRGVTGRLRGAAATGEEYQAVDQYLGNQISRFGGHTDPDDQLIASGLQDIRAHLRNAVQRQNGALGDELAAVDEAWSILVPAERAAANAPRGFFSPAQYRRELRSGDSRVRRRGMARGEVRGQEYAEAGMDVLPSQMPNPSGTSSHESYSLGNTRFYQGLATRALYGPTTQNALLRATVDRPAFLDVLGRPAAELLGLAPAPQAGAALLGGSTNALFGY